MGCQGSLIDYEHIEFAMDCMCRWILGVFYNIWDEDNNEDEDEQDENGEPTGPHDHQRCEAGNKGTCKKCNQIRNAIAEARTVGDA
jgi:hypothetical protein